ncbi:BRCA2-interacting transcriptional repressor EMSY [Eumeta japonica]|uniref:BRCA2-interacting transcriptional repressor EMSY n=1 Tax=Eumeta variegata TaxID=151549 RepID=A0A4C1Z9A5_EUMVA|nr:BRCA2-interacting transcriptional repressor EMSY [Eumeta japonica]
MISVFRAQGALEDNTKKLLEELRAVLHISHDRHSAEARRVANDEILATIAEQLAGPNTGLGWICEGRRKVPLMPRGIPQTMYTEIADKAAQLAAAENKEIKKRLEAEKLVAPKSNEEEMPQAEGETAEAALNTNESLDELIYPPIIMEDQTTKIWETEVMGRKRKITENSNVIEENATTPVKNIRNVTINSNQKHPNLSQIYSKYSQPTPSKQQQSKHSYNQVGKVSSKPNQAQIPRSVSTKHSRKQSTKHSSQIVLSKTQIKKSQELPISSAKPYSQGVTQVEYTGPPNTFQASYAQSVLGHKHKTDYIDEMKPKLMSPPGMMMDSPTMQLLTQPATVPHELGVSDGAHSDDPASLQAQAAPIPKLLNTKPCHLIIKKRGEIVTDTKPSSDIKVLQKTSEAIKFIPNRPVVVAPSSIHKVGRKIIPTKIMNPFPKTQNLPTILSSEKMIVVSKSSEQSIANSKIVISSTSATTPISKSIVTVSTNSVSPKIPENVSAKGLPATDLKVSAKTFLLNPKSGQKMVVLPSKSRTKTVTDRQTVPILHLKTIPPTIKLVPVTSQSFVQLPKQPIQPAISKASAVSAVSATNAKIVSVEPIKTANMADIVPVKGLQPITSTPKPSNAIIRPATNKGNVIVVQKGATLGKTLSFTKNGNDMSKIIMGKNVNQLLQASNTLKQEQKDGGATSGNVIVLELNNDQSARTTTMSKILETHTSKPTPVKVDDKNHRQEITEDTPVLFDNQITEETCTASSLDSNVESIGVDVPLDETELSMIGKDDANKCSFSKNDMCTKDTSNVADWDMELKNVTRKSKDNVDKLNSLHLDLGMSSDSDTEYVVSSHKTKSKHSPQESMQQATPSGDGFGSSVGLSHASRLLLCQLQDEGSSSNDSSFALNKGKAIDKQKEGAVKDFTIEKSESEFLNKAKEKLSEKVAELKSQRKRIDIYSTAISSSDINLDEFAYLDEGMMPGDEMFAQEPENKGSRDIKEASLDMHLSQLLGEVPSTTHTVSESLNE